MTKLERINRIIDNVALKTNNTKVKEDLERLKPKRKLLNKFTNKDITSEEFNKILREICNALYPEVLKKYPFSLDEKENKLSASIIDFYNIHYKTNFSSDIKIYPVSLDETSAKELYKNTLQNIIGEHLTSNTSYEDLINERTRKFKDKSKYYKITLENLEIKPYYGTPKFMYEHASFINECLKKLPFKTENLDNTLEEMKEFIENYPEIKSDFFPGCYPYFDKNYRDAYEKLEQNYLKFLEYEKTLMPYTAQIWQMYLTDPNNHNNNSFKYIIHTFSGGLVPPDEMTKACCSLATERLLTTPYGNCGLIYDFNPEAIETMCYEDAGSWGVSKREFIERNLPLTWQLTDSNVFYEYPKISKIILPKELEKYGISNNLVHNQELLNYTRFQAYTEIYLNRNAQAIGVFYTDNCPNIEEVKEYAKKYNLPLVHLSLQELRTQAGLNPIPTKIEPKKEANNTLNH